MLSSRDSPCKSVLLYIGMPSCAMHLTINNVWSPDCRRTNVNDCKRIFEDTISVWWAECWNYTVPLLKIFVGLHLLLEYSWTAAKANEESFNIFCIERRKKTQFFFSFNLTCFSGMHPVNIVYFYWFQIRPFKFLTLAVPSATPNTLNIT